jgi:hypothetical protein
MTPTPRDPSQRLIRLAATLRWEIERLDRIGDEAPQAARELAGGTPPPRELRGTAAILHDFYTGIERALERVAPELNGGIPAGPAWHRQLLETMVLDLPGVRPPVLRASTARVLEEYLRFRHAFRDLYGFELEWPRVEALLARLPGAWAQVREDRAAFVELLDETATA